MERFVRQDGWPRSAVVREAVLQPNRSRRMRFVTSSVCSIPSRPDSPVVPFGSSEASVAAEFYGTIRRSKGQEAGLAVAVTAVVYEVMLWTFNQQGFAGAPRLDLY